MSSQAGGFAGGPSTGQVRAAASNASAKPVLGEVEAAVLRDEQGQQSAPLVAQDGVESDAHAVPEWSTVPRTSMAPSEPARVPTTWSRSSRSSVSTM